MTLKVDKFGRILLPKIIRSALGLQPGSEMDVDIDKQRATLTLKPSTTSANADIVISDDGLPLVVGGEPYPDDFDTVQFLRQGYDDYHKERFGI